MPEPRHFRQTLRAGRISTAMAVGIPIILTVVFLASALILGPPIRRYWESFDWIFVILLVPVPLLFGLSGGYMAVFSSKDRIVISETQIERTGLRHFMIYRGPVLFEDLIKVARGNLSIVRIEQVEGKNFEFAPKAFEEGVFDAPEIINDPEILYTEDNSGYFTSHTLRIGPEERLWSLDMCGNSLVSIDPDVDELAAPLPDWFAAVSQQFWSWSAFFGTGAGI